MVEQSKYENGSALCEQYRHVDHLVIQFNVTLRDQWVGLSKGLRDYPRIFKKHNMTMIQRCIQLMKDLGCFKCIVIKKPSYIYLCLSQLPLNLYE